MKRTAQPQRPALILPVESQVRELDATLCLLLSAADWRRALRAGAMSGLEVDE